MMTREQLDQATDEQLNEMAAKVMGWHPFMQHNNDPKKYPAYMIPAGHVLVTRNHYAEGFDPWSPSTSIADAWELVEKMREEGFAYRIDGTPQYSSVPPMVKFTNGLNPGSKEGTAVLNNDGNTARAITTAALLAWGEKENSK